MIPGMKKYAGSTWSHCSLLEIRRPRSGVGSTTPMLRNDSAPSAVIVSGTPREKVTRIGAHRFGSNCRNSMCGRRAPAARAASMYSRSRSDST